MKKIIVSSLLLAVLLSLRPCHAAMSAIPHDRFPGQSSETSDPRYIKLDKAIADKDLEATKHSIITIIADAPSSSNNILRPERIKAMLKNGWTDYLLKLFTSGDSNFDTAYQWAPSLIAESYTDDKLFKSIFDLLAKLMRPDQIARVMINASDTLQQNSGASADLLEKANKIVPDQVELMDRLAMHYNNAGRAERAYELSSRIIELGIRNGKQTANSIYPLYYAAQRMNRWPETESRLWQERGSLSIEAVAEIARQLGDNDDAPNALKWIDFAYQQPGSSNMPVLHYLPFLQTRLTCLVKTGRADDARKALAEAEKTYPDHDWRYSIPGLIKIAPADPNSDRLKRALKNWNWNNSQPSELMISLAYALAKTEKQETARPTAKEVFPNKPEWQEGLVLAATMFAERSPLRLAEWTWTKGAQGKERLETYLPTQIAKVMTNLGEGPLASEYSVAATVIAPPDMFEGEAAGVLRDLMPWANVPLQERESLKRVLSSYKLNAKVLVAIEDWPRKDSDWSEWFTSLRRTQTSSPSDVLFILSTDRDSITSEDAQARIAGLMALKDWNIVRWWSTSTHNTITTLWSRGMHAEAERLAEVVLPHTPLNYRVTLLQTLEGVSGMLPTEPQGDEASSSSAWCAYGQVVGRLGHISEAKNALNKAIDLGKTPIEVGEGLRALSPIDPEVALIRITEKIALFPASDKSDWPEHLMGAAEALCTIAEKRKELAVKCVPLIDSISGDQSKNGWVLGRERALIHIWAGDPDGVKTLLLGLDATYSYVQGIAFGIAVRSDVPSSTRDEILKALQTDVESKSILPSSLVGWIAGSREFCRMGESEPNAEQKLIYSFHVDASSLIRVANMARQRIDKSSSIPEQYLCSRLLEIASTTAWREDLPPTVTAAWSDAAEFAIQKSVTDVSTAKAQAAWLKSWLSNCGSYFPLTPGYKKLAKLADKLERRK